MNNRTVLTLVITTLVAYAGGWFSHAALQPFLAADTPAISTLAMPGTPASQSRVVFQAPSDGNHDQQPMRVDQIKVLQETPDSLLLELDYFYGGDVPANEVKLFVGLDTKYLYLGNDQVHPGKGTMRMNIGLIESDMKADKVTQFDTSLLRLAFEHYPPGAYKGVLSTTVVPYQKAWALSGKQPA